MHTSKMHTSLLSLILLLLPLSALAQLQTLAPGVVNDIHLNQVIVDLRTAEAAIAAKAASLAALIGWAKGQVSSVNTPSI
jgi:hypothetical protein